jgi:hypothetical protein
MGRRPKERGGHEELTGGHGKEVVAPEEEIEAAALRRAAELRSSRCGCTRCERGGAKEVLEELGMVPPLYRVERGRGTAGMAVTRWVPLMVVGKLGGEVRWRRFGRGKVAGWVSECVGAVLEEGRRREGHRR